MDQFAELAHLVELDLQIKYDHDKGVRVLSLTLPAHSITVCADLVGLQPAEVFPHYFNSVVRQALKLLVQTDPVRAFKYRAILES